MSQYKYKLKDGTYVIYDGRKTLKTPAGNPVTTLYKELADRLVLDLNTKGYDFHSADSILAWHFTMIDNIAGMSHSNIENVLLQSFMQAPDWTFSGDCNDEKWEIIFGHWNTRKKQIEKWLEKCTKMQLTAICCIGNAYHTLKI